MRGWRWGHPRLVPASAEALSLAPPAREFPTAWARTPLAHAIRTLVQGSVVQPLIWTFSSTRVTGREQLQRVRPPVLFVANHASHLDAPLLMWALPPWWRRRTAVLAAADYFFDVWWRSALPALVFNAIPYDRDPRAGEQHTARRLVRLGWNLVAFPEGTRTADGSLQRFHTATLQFAREEHMAVVPVAIRGTFAAMPRGQHWPGGSRPALSVRFGKPLLLSDDDRPRALGRAVREAVEALLVEDETTWWNALRRSARAQTAAAAPQPRRARWRHIWEATRPPARRD